MAEEAADDVKGPAQDLIPANDVQDRRQSANSRQSPKAQDVAGEQPAVEGQVLLSKSEHRPPPALCCAACSFPCWLCNQPDPCPRERFDEDEDEDADDEDMEESTMTPTITTNRTRSYRRKRKRSDGRINLDPRDKEFRTSVLEACYVDITFEPEPLPTTALAGGPFHLDIDPAKAQVIAKRLANCHDGQHNEATLMKLIIAYLTPPNTDSETKYSRCRDKWRPCQPGPNLPDDGEFAYDWDIETDATYMVGAGIINSDDKVSIAPLRLAWIRAEPQGIGPYLTIDLKCPRYTGNDFRAANQIATAATIWLHQWKKIKDELGSTDWSDLQHYGIAIDTKSYQVYRAHFDGTAYKIQRVDFNSLYGSEGVERYVRWSNFIHSWGLGAHAEAFKRDVEELIALKRAEKDGE